MTDFQVAWELKTGGRRGIMGMALPTGTDPETMPANDIKSRDQALRTESDIALRILSLYYSLINIREDFQRDLETLTKVAQAASAHHLHLSARGIRAEIANCAKRWSLPSDLGERDLWEAAKAGRKCLKPSLGGASTRRILRKPRTLTIRMQIDLVSGTVEATVGDDPARRYSDPGGAVANLLRAISKARKGLGEHGLKPLPFRYRSPGELKRIADVLYRVCVLRQFPAQIPNSLGGSRGVRGIVQRWCPLLGIPRPSWPKGRPKKRSFTEKS